MVQCKRCGGEVVQRPRSRLILVGVLMLASASLAAVWSVWWAVALILIPTGLYLLAWGTLGKGRWCRGCKRFDRV